MNDPLGTVSKRTGIIQWVFWKTKVANKACLSMTAIDISKAKIWHKMKEHLNGTRQLKVAGFPSARIFDGSVLTLEGYMLVFNLLWSEMAATPMSNYNLELYFSRTYADAPGFCFGPMTKICG